MSEKETTNMKHILASIPRPLVVCVSMVAVCFRVILLSMCFSFLEKHDIIDDTEL